MKRIFLFLLSLSTFASCTNETGGVSATDVILPMPNSVEVGQYSISLEDGVQISSKGADGVANYLTKELDGRVSTDGSLDVTLVVDSTSMIEEQGYQLDITKNGVEILAADKAGAFYGAQTFLQLITKNEEGRTVVLSQTIEDNPRFKWRSYMLDEARHFFGLENIYRTLDIMADLKLNVLHWHLTDDAGWRIESKKYPLLTEIGSKRKDTEIGTWGSGKTAGEPHEGFYTQEQIREVVSYAKERHIKIVPEIEMPGHACASVAAYPWLATKNEKIEVPVQFGKHYYTYDVINPKVIEFLENVIVEVIDLFDTDVIHIGGDEVRFNQWEEDRDMVAYKKAKGYSSFMDIQIEFTNKMSHFIEDQGCSMMGWNEILGTNLHQDDNISFSETSTDVAKNVVVQFWKGDINSMSEAAAGGYRLVNSYHLYTYLDYGYQSISLAKAYDFEPIPADLDEKYHKNIFGIGCQMWSEWTPTVKDIERMTYPRLAAYAEVGWSNKEVKNYDSFVSRLTPIMDQWKAMGMNVSSIEDANPVTEK